MFQSNASSRYQTRQEKTHQANPTAGTRRALGDISNNTATGVHKVTKQFSDLSANASHRPSPPVANTRAGARPNSRGRVAPAMPNVQNWVDIDKDDAANPQACVEYVNEIYDHFFATEGKSGPSANYIARQADINEKMRAILVDWLVEVHLKFRLKTETLYLCVNIIDRYLERAQVSRSKLQLLGVTCLLLAAKYEEIYPPEVRDLVYVTDKAYTRQQILKMESAIVNTLGFKLTVPTHYKFLVRFIKAAQCDTRTKLIAYYFCEKTLCDYSMLKYKPSEISAAAVYLAMRAVNSASPWTPTLEHYSKYALADVMPCARDIVNIVQNASSANLQAINKKYSQQKFGDAAGAAKTVTSV